ncbi:hypothetical protein G6O69_17730 [Pseudenhygromyxa sp. WMMC2535]|uniref:hypothetical protein n=1 Tax=Pseudenhygromyxa sp. WMMC2535 TaxID=2712867 RepID=UPI0015565EED|nr:hypothetical protein [Pseudenhygromyxa sp. WMMC2535]NVB39688.1 hypothetical protein [Pseudenhygromyxa sp. WMMC2535]
MNAPLDARTEPTSPRAASARLRSLGPVGQWLRDPQVRTIRQPIDAEWDYGRHTSRAGVGFNPVRAEVHIAQNSLVARWLDGEHDLRALNVRDQFVRELMFCVHDYLHAWASLQINELAPALGFGTATLSPEGLETQAWALLVTEAVAVVGLDYWWLSRIDLRAELDIGSTFRQLTISYREEDAPEFRRAWPEFDAQRPEFLRALGEFYCHGRFQGFDLQDVSRSPALLRWLEHELSYGEVQRRYIREWLCHLGGLPAPSREAAGEPVACDADWQREVLDELGRRLWAKIVGGEARLSRAPIDAAKTWRAPLAGGPQGSSGSSGSSGMAQPIDARFINLAAFPDPDAAIAERGLAPASRLHWFDQRLRLCSFAGNPELLGLLPGLRASLDEDEGALARWVFAKIPRVEATPVSRLSFPPTRDLFFPK